MEAGVGVDPNSARPTQRCWVDGKEERDCFAIYAGGLNIAYFGSGSLTGSDSIEIAKVVKTRWLEVRDSFWKLNLSLNVWYKVSFQTRMRCPLAQWRGRRGTRDWLSLTGPTKRSKRNELDVGRFFMTEQNVGKMEFALEQLFGRWRTGVLTSSYVDNKSNCRGIAFMEVTIDYSEEKRVQQR
ncbi:hypothetical protein ACJRO7_005540 [Eucalyptus globulus]|uniref:Uncharacterized protein n=1 Tax=Eucalyptus globulus TaxID=34317 RepID=A0ABD3J7R1_EUCGL